jgi:hypothetical protein
MAAINTTTTKTLQRILIISPFLITLRVVTINLEDLHCDLPFSDFSLNLNKSIGGDCEVSVKPGGRNCGETGQKPELPDCRLASPAALC